jgi:hypothetical protein
MSSHPFGKIGLGKFNVCYLDFEFSGINEDRVKLVSCATYDSGTGKKRKWWLFKDKYAQQELRKYLSYFDLLVGYSCVAEARSIIALDTDPLHWKWVDLFYEYRMMTNNNDRLQWGKQLVEGKIKTVRKPKPKWERTEEDTATGFRATHSLAECTYKLTGEIRDTDHKETMRKLIISYPNKFTPEERNAILQYNMEDVVFLETIFKRIVEEFAEKTRAAARSGKDPLDTYLSEAMGRGRYAAHTAWMENRGYPINMKATKNFSNSVASILYDTQREITKELFPDVAPFKWNRPDGRFRWDQKATRAWIEETQDTKRWMKTDGGKKGKPQLSLSLEAFEKFFPFKHDYPKDNFGAQMVRFLKLKQNLYGFVPNPDSTRKNFWDSVGPDGRVRPYINPFAAQSARSQPASTGFMFLKPAWMRVLVQPEPGTFMAGIDYGSQEFFIAALKAGDMNMIKAYLSGDVYLAFGKLSGQIPQNGTKETHKFQRDLCKSTVLGISYLMTKYGLSTKLTNDTGKVWTEDDAQEQIDLFYDSFPELKEAQDELQEEYGESIDFIKLEDGWYMWGDNENKRSVVNVPIQGAGSVVMRRAVDLNHSMRGSPCAFTLHDALYIEDEVGNENKILTLRDAMREAFVETMPSKYRDFAAKIRLDPFAWSPDYNKDSELKLSGPEGKWIVPCSNLYIDERAQSEFDKFSKYFEPAVEDLV